MTPRTLNNGYRGSNGNFHNMIFLSLAIHLIVITIIFISIPTTSRHLTFGTAYSVQLVGSEVVLSKHDSSGLKDILQSGEAVKSIIIKRKITSIASAPVKKQEMNKFNIEKAVSAIRQKERIKSNPNTVASASDPAKISDAENTAQTNEYIAVVWSRVKSNFTLPQSLLPEKNITAIIDIRIARNGALEYADFEKRSGNRFFDDSALRAVKKSSPFPPLPHWIMDKSIEIGIRFNSAELH
jgi:colicin import membrane protein